MDNASKNIAQNKSTGKKSFVQFLKFGAVGASNTVIDMIVNILVTKLLEAVTAGSWITYAAKTVGYAAGVVNSYILNSRWTFKEERKQDKREILSFIAVNLAVYSISIALIYVFVNILHLDEWWMNLSAADGIKKLIGGRLFCSLLATVICIFVNFILNKLFVFKGDKKADA